MNKIKRHTDNISAIFGMIAKEKGRTSDPTTYHNILPKKKKLGQIGHHAKRGHLGL